MYFRKMKQHGGRALTDLTIKEIMALQAERSGMSNQEWIRQGRLHAVGRYQFIGKTLPGVVARSGIPTSAKFTPEVQDQLAIQYLKEAGISAWIGPRDKASREERAIIEQARKIPLGKVSSAQTSSSISLPNLQAPKGNNTINVPMPAQQQASGGTSSGGGIMDTLSNAGQALNRLITQRFLTNL